MDLALNILKMIGYGGGIVALIVVCARVWAGTARDKLIEVLQSELKVSREHCDECDKDVRHYRDEMHNTRNACADEIERARVESDKLKEALKQAEIETAGLKARTDLSPVMDTMSKFIKEQTAINHQILAALTDVAQKLNGSKHTKKKSTK